MCSLKLVLIAVLAVGANCRYVDVVDMDEEVSAPQFLILDDPIYTPVSPVGFPEPEEDHSRVRRQIGKFTLNQDMTSNLGLKVPVWGDNKSRISAIGSAAFNPQFKLNSGTTGFAYDTAAGHGASLTHTRIPAFGDRLTAAGSANLFSNRNHDLNANAFISRSYPKVDMPNFNTVGGGLDYMYRGKVGAELSASHTPLFQRNDMSATGKLNLFRDRDTSLDFKAGMSKMSVPNFSTGWQPFSGFSFSKTF